MGESSSVAMAFKKESVWGVKETGQYKYANFTEEGFALNKEKDKSSTILPTREYASINSKTQEAVGTLNTILQSGNIDELFESSLMSSWSDVVGGSGGGSITAGVSGSNLEITFTTETGGGVGGIITFGSGITAPSILKDQVIFITGAADAANNGAFIVKEVVDTHNFRVNSALVTATEESVCKVAGDVIRNGKDVASFSFEREHSDISKFFVYTGQTVSTTEFTFEPENEIMVNFAFVGKDEITASSTSSTPAPSARSTNPDFVVGNNVDGLYFDYDLVANCLVSDFSVTIDNQTEGRKSVAEFGNCNVRIKPIDVSGSATLWFQDFDEYGKYVNDTPFQLMILASDSSGNQYALTIAQTEYTTGTVNATDLEDETPEEHEFMSFTNGVFTVQICKVTI